MKGPPASLCEALWAGRSGDTAMALSNRGFPVSPIHRLRDPGSRVAGLAADAAPVLDVAVV